MTEPLGTKQALPLFSIIHNIFRNSVDGQPNNTILQTEYSSTVERDPEENMAKA